MYEPAPDKPYSESRVYVHGQKLQVVEKVVYLGSTVDMTTF